MTTKEIEIKIGPESDWKEIIFPKEYGIGRSFVGGDPNANRLIVRYYIRKSDKKFFSKVYFGELAQGPSHHAHGGSQAAVLDEAMGLAAWVADKSVVAANINIEFVKMLKLRQVAVIETSIDKVNGRKVWMKAELKDMQGNLCSRGSGLFIIVPKDKTSSDGFHHKLKAQLE